jgi:hypothetical protein
MARMAVTGKKEFKSVPLTTISGQLIVSVRRTLLRCLDEYAKTAADKRRPVEGINCAAHEEEALAAYVVAVAAVEAFINESCVAEYTKILTSDSAFWDLKEEWREKLDLRQKLVIVPQLLYQQSFKRGQQPYEDMDKLIDIRNDLVHYKMRTGIPKSVDYLVHKKIPLSYPEEIEAAISWPALLSCSEGVRWAHNTACRTAHALVSFVPDVIAKGSGMKQLCDANFTQVDDAKIREWLEDLGIKAES